MIRIKLLFESEYEEMRRQRQYVSYDEMMGCDENVCNTRCAIRVADRVVDAFGHPEEWMEFSKALRQAITSGKYTVAGENWSGVSQENMCCGDQNRTASTALPGLVETYQPK